MSLLSPQYGYACDGLVSADIVTAEGKIKTLNAKTDAQLLRAIKGGGGKFGVVTRYTLQAFPRAPTPRRSGSGAVSPVSPPRAKTS